MMDHCKICVLTEKFIRRIKFPKKPFRLDKYAYCFNKYIILEVFFISPYLICTILSYKIMFYKIYYVKNKFSFALGFHKKTRKNKHHLWACGGYSGASSQLIISVLVELQHNLHNLSHSNNIVIINITFTENTVSI